MAIGPLALPHTGGPQQSQVSFSLCVGLFVCVYVGLCLYVCVGMSVSLYLFLCVCVSVYIYMSGCLSSEYVSVCLSDNQRTCGYLHAHVTVQQWV